MPAAIESHVPQTRSYMLLPYPSRELCSEGSARARRVRGAQSQVLGAAVIDYIEQHYSKHLSLRDVATAFGYSCAHLTNRFRRETGIPVTAWIVRRRIRAAAQLLFTTRLPVRTVCEKVGFNDPCYFTRQFVRVVGLTPGQYRRSSERRLP